MGQTVEELDILQAHGLRALWKGSLDSDTIISIRNHPALYDYFVVDEPSASRFDFLAGEVSRIRNLDQQHASYINLLPTNQPSSRYEVSDYQTYLNTFIDQVHPELLSYDCYQFMADRDLSDYFKNLAIVSHTAKTHGLPFMNIVQSCKWGSTWRNPNGNELRYLYNTSLAYGAQGISDFVYYVPDHEGGMANGDGTTTALYTTAQALNPQFEAIATQVQPLKHIGAYHLGDLPPGYDTTDGSSPLRLPGTSPFTVSGIATTNYVLGDPVRGAVVGLWGSNDSIADATYAFVTNLNYSGTLTTRITGPEDLSIFDPITGKWIAQGHAWADVTLEQGGGVLVGLTSVVPEPATWISLLGALITGLGLLRLRMRKA